MFKVKKSSLVNKKILKKYILPTVIFMLIIIILFRNVVFSNGLIAFGDFTVPLSLKNYIHFYYPSWNPFGSYSNFAYLSRLILYGPFLMAATLIKSNIETLVKFLALFPLILSFLSMYIASNFLTKKISKNSKSVFISTFLVSSFYALNPWVVSETRHFSLIWGYAFAPLILIMYISYLEKTKTSYKQIFILTLLLSFASITPHWIIVNALILFSWFIFTSFHSFLKRDLVKIYKNFLKNLKILTMYAVINAFWIVPIFFSSLHKSMAPSYVFTNEVLVMLSRNAELTNVIRLISSWWPQVNWSFTSHITLWEVSGFMLPFLAFVAIILKPKNKYVIYFSLLTLLVLFLGMGSKSPFPGFYHWLAFNSPLLSKIGWVFRNPERWVSVLGLTFSFLTLFTMIKITQKNWTKYTRVIPVIMLILFGSVFSFYAYPTIDGYSTKILNPVQIPNEYYDTNNFLVNQNDSFKVIWLPEYAGKKTNWSKGHMLGPFDVISSAKPSIGCFTPYASHYMNYIYSQILLSNKTSNFGKYLEFLNSRYVLFHNDIINDEKEGELAIQNLRFQKDLELVRQEGFISIFENKNYANQTFIPTRNILISGGLDKLTSLNFINSFTPINSSLIFLDQVNFRNKFETIKDIRDSIIICENLESLTLSYLEDKYKIEPFTHTNHHKPSTLWSKAKITDPLHGPFHYYLDPLGIENWDFDYDKGLVFTWAPSILEEPSSPKKEDILITYDFEDSITSWGINVPNLQKMFLTNMSHHGESSLAVELNASEWGWKTISSPLIPVNYGSQYKWEFYVKGKDAYKVHAKVIECKETKEMTNAYHMSSIGSGDFDWEKVSFNFIPSSFDSKYMQLQIWHGHETNQPVPNKIWIDDVKVYDLSNYLKPNSLEMPFKVEKDGSYELFIRYFKNQDGGKIGLRLDGDLLAIIETEDQLNKFTWDHLKTLDLKQGSHTLTLENIEGFNAVNIFALIPSTEYKNTEKEMYNLLKDKRVIYLFEVETDLYRKNTEVLNIGGEASNGEALPLQADSRIWRDVEILRDGDYIIALRLNGSTLIKIDNQTCTVNSTYLDFVYFNLHLEKGEHRIELLPEQYQPITWTFDESENNFEEWREYTPESPIYNLSLDKENETSCLKAELYNSTWGWKLINSPLIPITPYKEYLWKLEIKGENAHAVHAKIVEYNQSEKLIQATRLGSIGDGTFDWKNVSFSFNPTSTNTSYMQLQIWHGHNTAQPLPNIIWLDNVKTYGYSPSKIDVLWIYSSKENETIDDLFATKENPAQIITYEKIDPTEYIVTVNATAPFMLSFAESYDPLWAAYTGNIEYQPIPLYSVINGFWINKTGNLEIIIRYKPQDWFETGSLISIIALIGCTGYLFYDWKKNDERIKMIKRKMCTILKKKK